MNSGLEFTQPVEIACNTIIKSTKTPQQTINIISSIQTFGQQRGFITKPQATLIGGAYKKYINNGQYIKHDWWPQT